jgi:hypothetical protein
MKLKEFDPVRILSDLHSEVDIPDAVEGNFSITHDTIGANKDIDVVSMRNMVFMGYKHLKIKLPYSYKVTQLKQDGGTWMSDVPNEIFSLSMGIDEANGHVLVGGLGLGYCVQKMANKKSVKWVTVVEKSAEVIKLVAPYLKKDNVEVIHDDLYDYLKKTKNKFDYCYYDIWASTGEREIIEHIIPLRKLSKRVLRPNGKMRCWGEDEMFGQVEHNEQMQKEMAKTSWGKKMKQCMTPLQKSFQKKVRRAQVESKKKL